MNKTKNNVKSVLKEFKNFVKKYKKQNPRECQIKAVETLFGKAHSKFLFNMCCGAGKTIIESFLIFKEIVDCNKNGKLARVMVASHRLLLNNQLVQIVNDALNSNKITNVEWWSLSSNVTFELGNETVIQANKFTKDSIDSIKVSDKHIIIVACAASEKKHFKEMDSDTMENILNNELKKLEADNFLNLIVQDEIHKDIPMKVLRNFEKISNKVFGFTATPNNKNIEWFGEDNVYEYWFSKALEDGIVVKGKLYISKPSAKKLEKQEASNIIVCFEHLSRECKNMNIVPVFLNYFSSVDNLTHYEKTITNKYGSSVDVAVFASYKEIKDEKGATKVVSQCELNNTKKIKEELLEFCQTQRNKNKPLIILSAYMIVEGIDIPSINGVGIWCEKNDANMFQAACRGCRTDIVNNPNKTHFYIYTSENLASDSKDFLEKLYNGFNEQLDFGDGQEDCEGTGKTNDDSKNNQDGFIIVPAKAVKTVSAVIEEITLDLLDEKFEKQDIENENYVNSEEFKKHVDKEFKTSKGSDFGTQRKNQAIVESNTNGMFVYFDKRYNQIYKKMNYIERTWMWLVYNRPKVALKAKDEQNICLRYVKNRITLLNICKQIKRRKLKEVNKNYDKAYEYIKKHKSNWKDYLIF